MSGASNAQGIERARREAVTAVAAQVPRAKGARARGQRSAKEPRRCRCSKQADDQLDHQHQGRPVNRQGGTRTDRAVPTADRIDKKNVKSIPNCREQSGQGARTAKVRERTLEVPRRTDETKDARARNSVQAQSHEGERCTRRGSTGLLA